MGLNLVPFSYLVHMGTPNVLPRARHSAQPTQRPTQWQMPGVRKAEGSHTGMELAGLADPCRRRYLPHWQLNLEVRCQSKTSAQ